MAELPAEAQTVHRRDPGRRAIRLCQGRLGLRQSRALPARAGPSGYYREYTVTTPGARDRGARRIVCGGSVPVAPAACYYTADHYASFKRITP